MLNDDTHAQHVNRWSYLGLHWFCYMLDFSKLLYKFSTFCRCNDTCTCFSKCYIIKQLLTNEALDMMWYRPENTNIDLGFASVNISILWSISHHIQCLISSPRSILVFSGRYHIISNASLVNNCIIVTTIQIKTWFTFSRRDIQPI